MIFLKKFIMYVRRLSPAHGSFNQRVGRVPTADRFTHIIRFFAKRRRFSDILDKNVFFKMGFYPKRQKISSSEMSY